MPYAPECILDVRCGCAFTQWEEPRSLSMGYQHGENPEHRRSFPVIDLADAGYCENGHILAIEEWVQSDVERCVTARSQEPFVLVGAAHH